MRQDETPRVADHENEEDHGPNSFSLAVRQAIASPLQHLEIQQALELGSVREAA